MKKAEQGLLIPFKNEILHVNKLDNLDKVEKFLERHKLLNLTQELIENLNRPKTRRETELVN